jgi:hypothetical protein
MSKEKIFVPSELTAKASDELEKTVAAELKEHCNASVEDENKNKDEFRKIIEELNENT